MNEDPSFKEIESDYVIIKDVENYEDIDLVE